MELFTKLGLKEICGIVGRMGRYTNLEAYAGEVEYNGITYTYVKNVQRGGKHMKTIVSLITAITLLFALTACGAQGEVPAAAPAAAAAASVISAPLPGTITKILVEVGQAVKAGDTVLTMEAMKMENNITAESAGTVKAILVQQGAQVQSGDAMIEIG